MKKKFYLFLGLLFCSLTIILIYKSKDSKLNGKEVKEEKLSIMIKEEGAEDYTKSSSKDIPKGDYTLNEEKTHCENNGEITSYDNVNGTIGFSFIGSDRCTLYFDYKEETNLYNIVQKRYNSGNAYVGLYTGEESDSYQNKVYYYKDDVEDNNVLFGNFCWKMVRTTDTGGVKLIYNGVKKYASNDYILLNQSEYTNLVNSSNYPYTFDETNKTWTSTNTGTNSSEISFSAPSNGDYILNYDLHVYSMDDYIYIEIFKDNISQGKITGIVTGQIYFKDLTSSNVIKVVYTRKSSNGYVGRNNVIFSVGKANSITVSCNNTGSMAQIGKSAYNSSYNSPTYVGYMYNNAYTYSSKTILNSISFSGTKVYGDGVTYASSKYTLTNVATLSVTSSNISTLVGKYTCNSSNRTETCTNAMYIVGYSGNYIYYYSLFNGDLDGTDNGQNYVFGSSFTYANGSYTLTGTTTINSGNWLSQYTNVNTHHYTCLSSGATCTSLYYVYYVYMGSAYYITLTEGKSVDDALNEMLYNDDVNTKDSTIKTYIDNWYKNNMTSYTEKLEDTVFCNDRSMNNKTSNGWYPNGGSTSTHLYFKDYDTSNTSLKCTNANDKFTVESSNGNGALTYPVGLLTVSEATQANYNKSCYLFSDLNYWLMSPNIFNETSYVRTLNSSTTISSYNVNNSNGVRPVISLKPGTEISSGDGSYTSPFEIK